MRRWLRLLGFGKRDDDRRLHRADKAIDTAEQGLNDAHTTVNEYWERKRAVADEFDRIERALRRRHP